jgi:hypothetical protein
MLFSKTWKKGILKSSKHQSYLNIYDEVFKGYKNKNVKILEFGVSTGGSLESYSNYFSSKSIIVGVDLDLSCQEIVFNKKNIHIVIGDMTNPLLYQSLRKKYGKFDIIIDDGGHTNFQMLTAFVYSIQLLKKKSFFISEDTHCSYLTKFNNPSSFSFMSFINSLVDKLSIGYIQFKSGNTLSSISLSPGIAVFKFIDSSISGNPQIYNNGYKTINAIDQRFNSNVSRAQLCMLFLYAYFSNNILWKKTKNLPLMKCFFKKLYVYILIFISSDTLRIISVRKNFYKMIRQVIKE